MSEASQHNANNPPPPRPINRIAIFNILMTEYRRVTMVQAHVPPPRQHHIVTFANTLGDHTMQAFRFRSKADIQRVFNALRIPAQCGPLDNGVMLPGEHLFLVLLRRLAHGLNYTDLVKVREGRLHVWPHTRS